MKLLIVSNLYPPYYRGGYELHCAWVASGLARRGHDVAVLTSTYGLREAESKHGRTDHMDDVRVYRKLGQYAYVDSQRPRRPWTFWQARAELADVRTFRALLALDRPDAVYWWSMNGLSKTLLPVPATLGLPDVHCLDDLWMVLEFGLHGELAGAFWRRLWDGEWGPAFARPLLRGFGAAWEQRVLREGISSRELIHRPSHVVFQSKYMEQHYRDAGFRFPSSEVIYGGVKVEDFLAPRVAGDQDGPLRVLYAGQLSRDRGAHTAIDAVAALAARLRGRITLTVVGSGDPVYTRELQDAVNKHALQDVVSFRGKVPHAEMPQVYRTHDVLVFTSMRPEGQGFTMVEAMLAGCAVLTTGSGGAMDVAQIAQLPMFAPGNASELARMLARLVGDRSELREIAARGQRISRDEFDAELMITRQESMLARLTARHAANTPAN